MRKLTNRELGTVLAAVRFYQEHLEKNDNSAPKCFVAIASNEGELEPLTTDEIDILAEQLNCETAAIPGISRTSDTSEKRDYLRERVTDLISDLDSLGFDNPDEQVSGSDTVDVLNEYLPQLRELIA